MDTITATVLVPTTGDRGPLLPYSVGSVLAQTQQDIEVFIIGDGIDRTTQSIARDLTGADPRVRLFEFPKHPRRGEPHRHDLLTTEARGRIVTYICDRDLWLPTHVAELAQLLNAADFAYALRVGVNPRNEFDLGHLPDLRNARARSRAVRKQTKALVPLSLVAHTLDAYRRLPHGWRTTPAGTPTDSYMWLQFLAEPWVEVASSQRPTALTFRRGDHPGWSTERRLETIVRWSNRLAEPGAASSVERDVRALSRTKRRRPKRARRARSARYVRRVVAHTARWLRLR